MIKQKQVINWIQRRIELLGKEIGQSNQMRWKKGRFFINKKKNGTGNDS